MNRGDSRTEPIISGGVRICHTSILMPQQEWHNYLAKTFVTHVAGLYKLYSLCLLQIFGGVLWPHDKAML